MCPGTTAIVGTLKDQTDREEHCSTLVGTCTLAKYHSHHLGLYLYLYLPASAQAQEEYMFHWDRELTL
jgi:hypothetical protein